MSDLPDRALLERKSRQELVTIAIATGVNVTARTRKDQIIDAILTGGGPDGAGPDSAGPDDANPDGANPHEASQAGAYPGDGAENAADAADPQSQPTRRTATLGGSATANATANASADGSSESKGASKATAQDAQNEDVEDANLRQRRRGPADAPAVDPDADVRPCDGLLELRDEGYGFLRTQGLMPSPDDVYVAARQVRQFGLRRGDRITGTNRPAGRSEKNPALLKLFTINGVDADAVVGRPHFDELTAVYPSESLASVAAGAPPRSAAGHNQAAWNSLADAIFNDLEVSCGQRVAVVVPSGAPLAASRALRAIATHVKMHHPDAHVIFLAVDERPEEATATERALRDTDEVIVGTADRSVEENVNAASMTLERAKRMAETGTDVVLVFDGLSRLGRLYGRHTNGRNQGPMGPTAAVAETKRYFAAARNLEQAGSLTMFATVGREADTPFEETMLREVRSLASAELRLEPAGGSEAVYASGVEALDPLILDSALKPLNQQMVDAADGPAGDPLNDANGANDSAAS